MKNLEKTSKQEVSAGLGSLDIKLKQVARDLHLIASIVESSHFEGGDTQKESFISRLKSLRGEIIDHMVTDGGQKLTEQHIAHIKQQS